MQLVYFLNNSEDRQRLLHQNVVVNSPGAIHIGTITRVYENKKTGEYGLQIEGIPSKTRVPLSKVETLTFSDIPSSFISSYRPKKSVLVLKAA